MDAEGQDKEELACLKGAGWTHPLKGKMQEDEQQRKQDEESSGACRVGHAHLGDIQQAATHMGGKLVED